MPEGMRITLSGLGGGLTVDLKGKRLLPAPFVFQCPPLEEFKVTHAFTMANYDTLYDGQFARRGSRQLMTWSFDTLVMEIGLNEAHNRHAPGWIPFPQWRRVGVPHPPSFWTNQLKHLHDAGAPFKFVAEYEEWNAGQHGFAPISGPMLSTAAVLLGFSETHKHGEGDAIYLEGVSFSEWRDPTIGQKHQGHPSDTPPTTVTLRRDGSVLTQKHHIIPKPPAKRHATLCDLSKFFYHSPNHWREIANANKLTHGGGNTGLVKFPKYHKIPPKGVTVKIPKLPPHKKK